MKRKFPCGHKGKGQYCHKCAYEKTTRLKRADSKLPHDSLISNSTLNLGILPPTLAIKTSNMVKDLQAGAPYTKYRGKRLNYSRNIISIPLGKHYRLVCRKTGSVLEPIEVLSHEDYNNEISKKKW